MPKRKLRKNADISPPQSPHDEDTCPHLVVLGRLETENARLKAEVERLKGGAVKAGEEISHMERHVIASMRAEIERLRRLTPSEDDRNRGGFNP